MYDIPDLNEDWGSVYVNLSPHGQWNEGGVAVEGSPYSISFAPRLLERPSLECALHIIRLAITPVSGTAPAHETARLDLTAGPASPREPNWKAHSAYFHFVPLSEDYVTSGTIDGLELPYEAQRVVFSLQGNSACPSALRSAKRYDVLIKTHPYRGKTSPWPSV